MKVNKYPAVKVVPKKEKGRVNSTSEKRYCIQPRAMKSGQRDEAESVICEKKDLPNASFVILLQALYAGLSPAFKAFMERSCK